MKFSLVIPLAPGRNAEILDSIKQLDYSKKEFEIIVEEGTNPSDNRNKGAKKSKGEKHEHRTVNHPGSGRSTRRKPYGQDPPKNRPGRDNQFNRRHCRRRPGWSDLEYAGNRRDAIRII